jgi:hypothetical protein
MPGNSPDAGAGWLPGLAPRRMRLRGVASVAQLGRTFNARRRPGRGGTDQRSASTVIATRQWCLQPRAHAAAPSAGRARAPPSIGGTAVRVAERAPCSPPVRPALNPVCTAAGARHELPSCKPRRRLGTGFGRRRPISVVLRSKFTALTALLHAPSCDRAFSGWPASPVRPVGRGRGERGRKRAPRLRLLARRRRVDAVSSPCGKTSTCGSYAGRWQAVYKASRRQTWTPGPTVRGQRIRVGRGERV